ncbi:MAG: tetratricopeptide repeat protein [Nitrospinae bacterium]|nr:tetratricopeptide repeat protein [Nitrospinota bacterium]
MSSTDQGKKPLSLADYFKGGYILVADDMSNMRKTLKNMLRQVGIMNVVEAEDGDTAIKVIKTHEEKCLFALLDWNMPRLPGIHAAREIRSDAKIHDTPILMVTAEIDKGQVAQAGEIGVNGYIIKPFVAKTLEEKIEAILDARENPPEYVKLLKAGEALAKMGQYEKALAVFNEVMNKQGSARVLVHIGDLHELMGEYDKAQAVYQEAVVSNPQYLKAHVKSAEVYMKQGDEAAALSSLQKASEISPANAERHVEIAKIHMKKGDDVAARAALENAVRYDPRKATEIAEELLTQGKPQMAEGFFRKTLEKHADSVHIYNRLGIALRRQGKWQEAITEYEKAIKVDPHDEGLYFNMAKAYVEGNKLEEAFKLFTKVTHLNPRLQEAKKELETLARRMQNPKG